MRSDFTPIHPIWELLCILVAEMLIILDAITKEEKSTIGSYDWPKHFNMFDVRDEEIPFHVYYLQQLSSPLRHSKDSVSERVFSV